MKMLTLFIVVLFFAACDLVQPVERRLKDIDELLAAPVRITIDDREYYLDTFLWRDFQPVAPPDGRPLIALIWVIAADSLAMPPDIDATRIWVIHKNEVWESRFSDESRPDSVPEYQLEKIARNGPKWGPDVFVEVVVRVIDTKSGDVFLLRASEQYIGMTM